MDGFASQEQRSWQGVAEENKERFSTTGPNIGRIQAGSSLAQSF